MDTIVDITIVYIALKSSLDLILIFLALLGGQAIAAPIQGLLSDFFSLKNSLLLPILMGFSKKIKPVKTIVHKSLFLR